AVVGEAARGDHVGEMAVLTGEPRAASAVAVVESVLYALPGELLRELFAEHPILWARLSVVLMRNLQTQGRSRVRGVRTCAVVGAGRGAARSWATALARAEALGAGGETVAVLECVPDDAAPVTFAALPAALSELTQSLRRLVTPGAPPHPHVTTIRLGSD